MNVTGAWSIFPQWQKFIGQKGLFNGSFPDGDMLPFGDFLTRPSALTHNESRSLMTL